MIDPKIIIQGLTFKELIFKYLKMFGVLAFIFYYTYPQALDVFGRSSFIVPAAVAGLGLYAWNKFPFVEVPKVIAFFLAFIFFCYFCEYMAGTTDGFRMTYIRSQMAWFFAAYFANFLIFNVHKNPKFEVIVGYIAAAVILQCVITFAMNQYEWADKFFYSLQMKNTYTEEVKEMTEEQRLMGYGTAFFGAGMVAGYGLILIVYLVSVLKLNKIQLSLFAASFAFVFFIGLFSARTTTIGLAAAIALLIVLYFVDKKSKRKQSIQFIGISIILIIFGAGLATQYFPDYTDWAYEMFDNFMATGKFSTDSSDALYYLFYLPAEFRNMMIGEGRMDFWGNDMGYTRLIFYIGFIGAAFYFAYQIYIASFMMTKDLAANILVLMIVAYSMILNIKGLTDLNPVLYLFFFYFLFHKYYRYFPYLYRNRMIQLHQQRIEQEKENPQTTEK